MKIKLKRSSVLESGVAKEPTAGQLEYGELAVNYNESDPAIFIKDSNDNVIRVAGNNSITGGGSEVLISDTAPAVDDLEEGTLWWNSDSESGQLFVLYNDPANGGGTDPGGLKWVEASTSSGGGGGVTGDYLSLAADAGDQTVLSADTTTFTGQVALPGGGNDTQALQKQEVEALIADVDGNYLKLAAGAGDQTVASTGTTTFDGVVEASGGVNAAGYQVAGGGEYVNLLANTSFNGTAGNTLYKQYLYLGASSKQAAIAGTFVSGNLGTTNKATGDVWAFVVSSGLTDSSDSTSYGFYSGLNSGTGKNYNFFAAGDAPNFFTGSTYIGGTATRNTRELWESTLTEEQKEQLAAGTLAIPANVSTPGDGSFVRQWWYDQQSVEDQALIDAGELDYPERYQAANFVDTFELGVDTNINLLSGGQGQFKSVKGTSFIATAADASNELFGAGTDSLPGIDGFGGVNLCAKGQRILRVLNTGSAAIEANPQVDPNGFAQGLAIQVTAESREGGKQANDSARNLFVGGKAETDAVNRHIGIASVLGADTELLDVYEAIHVDDNNLGGTSAQDIAKRQIGVLSAFSSSDNPEVDSYNFYAAGNAPNVFKGRVLVGGPETPIIVDTDDQVGVNINFGNGVFSSNDSPSFYLRRLDSYGSIQVFYSQDKTLCGYIASLTASSSEFDAGVGGEFTTKSDYRLKQNIQDITDASSVIQQPH